MYRFQMPLLKEQYFQLYQQSKTTSGFTVGIGYDDSISKAQDVVLKVLENHPPVLKDPETLALVDALGAAIVNSRIYFWINGEEYVYFKVKSAIT